MKVKNDQKVVRDSNPRRKLLTNQLSDVRELETIKYAFAYELISVLISCKTLH